MTTRRLPLAVLALSVGLTSTGAIMPATAATAAPIAPAVAAPEADLLDVSFEDGTPADAAQDRAAETFGNPTIAVDGTLARSVGDFDGKSAFSYPMAAEDYDQLADGFAVECNFKRTAATTGEDTVCGNKEAGGYAMVVQGDRAAFMIHAEGKYTFAWAEIDADRWYHAVGSYDGETVKLYLDGELAAEAQAGGPMTIPANEDAHNFVVGADSGKGEPGQHATVAVDAARLYGEPVSAEQVAALNEAHAAPAEAPAADILNVDFTDGTARESAQDLPATALGDPEITEDPALGRNAVTFDGDDALLYPMGEQYAAMTDSFAVECVFRYNGSLPSSGQTNMCANKESGGFAVAMFGNKLTFELHTGSYQNIGVEIEPNEWYHAVAVFDGGSQTAKLYVNGELAAEVETVGTEMHWPPNSRAHNMVLGADSSSGGAQWHSTSTVASARIFSDSLDAQQVAALNVQAFGGLRDQQTELASVTPAAGSEVTRATEFAVEWADPDLVAAGTSYTLDGEPIELGQAIGEGLAAGEHTIEIEGKTVFGAPISESITFTSGSIPVGGGTDTGQGSGSVTLSAIADNPDGGDVTSTFYAGTADVAGGGFQGLVSETPSTLDFEYTDEAELDGSGESLSAGEGQIAFQRFDVEVGEAAEGQSVRWTGAVDPARQVNLAVWNSAAESWDVVASGRGLADGELVLAGELSADHVVDGKAPVLVTGEDPFADDLDEPVRDALEDPEDYDFSMVHLTDTQFLSEGAAEDAYSQEQRDVWHQAYKDALDWIVENEDERKIQYVGHTGDVIQNWQTANRQDEEAYIDQGEGEFEAASEAQKILDDAEIVNGVLPGNHDNLTGADNGADAKFNDYFGPERYEALEQTEGWKAKDASYHPYAEGDNSNHYDLFTTDNGMEFIALHLAYDVTQEEIDWANEVLEQYSDRNAILLTHAYNGDSTEPDGRGASYSHDGSRVDEGIIQQNENVFLALSGHVHGVSIKVRQDVGTEGNHVVELLADYQNYRMTADEVGLTGVDGRSAADSLRFGASFLRMLQFDVDRAEMSVDTYSPFMDDFGASEHSIDHDYDGTEDDFRVPVQLETRKTSFSTENVMVTTPTDEVIGEATAKSGWPASVEWTGLTEDETYAWYVTSRDAETGDELEAGQTDQMGVFTATAAGTDDQAPELTVPDAVSIAVGDAFDPLDGVSATDGTDGDVTESVQVIGSVDTETAGTYTLTYVVEDANGNQAIASRTVIVEAAGEPGEPGEPADPGESQEPVFSDNPEGSAFFTPVQWMAENEISVGYADGTFKKTKDVTRGETAAFLYRYVGPEFAEPTSSPFTDMTAGGAFFAPVTWAAEEEITAGFADGSFKPSQPVTRGEFAAFLYRMAEPEFTVPETSPFEDLNAGGANYAAITWLAAEGITVGDTQGDFNQSEEITRGEISAFLQRYDATVDGR